MKGFWVGLAAGVVATSALNMWMKGDAGHERRNGMARVGRRMKRMAKDVMRRSGDAVDFLEEALE